MTSQHSIPSSQSPLGVFPNQQLAEQAFHALETAGFSADQISIDTQAIDPNPQRKDSKANKSAQGGAIAGAIVGCMIGFMLVLLGQILPNTQGMSPVGNVDSWYVPIGIIVIAGIAGALGTGLIAGLSGVNVPDTQIDVDRDRLANNYLIRVEGTDADRQRAQEILRQQGSEL